MSELITELRKQIKESEEYKLNNGKFKNTFYFKSSLANGIGTLAGVDNPPKGRGIYIPDDKTLARLIFNLKSSRVNPI